MNDLEWARKVVDGWCYVFKIPKVRVKQVNLSWRFRKWFGFSRKDVLCLKIPAFYDYRTKTILIDKKDFVGKRRESLRHEFNHYLQHLGNPKGFVAWEERNKKAAGKGFYHWSKTFARSSYEKDAQKGWLEWKGMRAC